MLVASTASFDESFTDYAIYNSALVSMNFSHKKNKYNATTVLLELDKILCQKLLFT